MYTVYLFMYLKCLVTFITKCTKVAEFERYTKLKNNLTENDHEKTTNET